jgi:ribonuclease HI
LSNFLMLNLVSMITIYTDGSSRGNPGPGGWGSVIIFDDYAGVGSLPAGEAGKEKEVRVKEIGGREEHTTNNRMELTAVIKALEFPTSYSLLHTPIHLHTDSEYVMKGITEWVFNWQKKGWKTANKKPVLNQDLWQELLRVSADKKIEWKYVAGHSGHNLNERCDEIATSFADGLEPNLYDGPKRDYKVIL